MANIISIGGGSGDYSKQEIKKYIERSHQLINFTIPEGVTSIGAGAFMNCLNLELSSLPDTVTTIDRYAFYDCRDIELTNLPNGVTSIGESAFFQCQHLAFTNLPNSITTISKGAFQSCTILALTSLPSNITRIEESTFESCPQVAFTTLPDGITYIGQRAFYNCRSLITISCNGQISHQIGTNAFGGSNMQLQSAYFPNMKEININVIFGSTVPSYACQLLQIVDLGLVKSISANSFANCYALQTLILRRTSAICSLSNVSAFTNTPLRGYNSLTATVYVPSALIATYRTATNWSSLYNAGTVNFIAIEGSAYE